MKMSAFLETSGKLNPNQHGFRQNHSCQTQLLEAVYQWANTLNAGQSTHVIFIDFSKAFDTVPHERLLLKRVVINGTCSDWRRVPSGVPQVSILWPLLFLVYIDDVAIELDSPCRLFADDCHLSSSNIN